MAFDLGGMLSGVFGAGGGLAKGAGSFLGNIFKGKGFDPNLSSAGGGFRNYGNIVKQQSIMAKPSPIPPGGFGQPSYSGQSASNWFPQLLPQGSWPGGLGGAQNAVQPKSKGWFEDLFGGVSKGNMLGMGITALGGLMRPPSQVPQTTPSIEQLRALSQSGGGPMGQRAQSELEGLMNQQYQPMNQVEEDAIRRNYGLDRQRRIKELQDRYRNARPGTDYTTDTQYKQDENLILNELANQENAALAGGRRQISQDFQSNRLRQILAAKDIDTNNVQLMNYLATLDLTGLQDEFKISRDDAYYIKNLLTEVGGRYLPQQPMNFAQMFGMQQPKAASPTGMAGK